MKTKSNFKTPKTLSFSFFLFLLAITVTSMISCNKNSDNANVSANVMAVNSAQASSPQDFYVDNAKVNSSAIAYTQNSGYTSIGSGNHAAQFKTSATASVNTSFNFSASPAAYYTVVFTDNNTASTYQNDRTTPQSNNARVRFINVSSALTGNVDFANNTGASVVAGLAYKAASAYSEIAAGTTFKLSASGSSTVLLNIPVTLQAGHIYTIFISGATSATITYTLVAES